MLCSFRIRYVEAPNADRDVRAAKRRAGWGAGFTLLELMVVLTILALLASIAAPRVTKYLRRAKVETAKIQVDALAAAITSFHLDTGRFPNNDEGLHVLLEAPSDRTNWDGPYIQKADSLIDPWGYPYQYKTPGRAAEFDVYTLGADHKEGGEGDAKDIGNW
jgi:general secretion pathway protein G